ncbi:MAG: hypothetical protein ABIJ57_09480 [Pseudomonadota bacterium]|uniref:Uncharacterized protein n=1 Tax=viral metagenome TaxID=1070528 RepID=A0A6M3KP25_9ZZZZ
MANTIYGFNALTGGAAGALDYIDHAILVDGDPAFGNVAGVFFSYTYSSASVAAESSPDVIAPDTGTGRWLLQNMLAPDVFFRVATADFTAAPASTSTLTIVTDLTATIKKGMPLKYVIGGTTYYGMVTAIVANLLTIAGAPLSGSVTSLYYGSGSRTVQVVIVIPDLYEDATDATLIASDLNSQLVWNKPPAYLVRYRVYSKTKDGSSDGKATVLIDSSDVNSSAGGLTIAASATWYSTIVDINTTNYSIAYGEVIEIKATQGTGLDATYLTVEMTFVIP